MRKQDLRRARAIERFEKELRDLKTLYFTKDPVWLEGKKAAIQQLIQNTEKNMGRRGH